MKKLAVVIGGSSGIGFAICHDLKDEYAVVNMSRRENVEVENIYCDVSDYDSIQKAFSELMDKYGVPYVLIYCSGYVDVQSIYEVTEEALSQTFQVNIFGAFRCVKEYLNLNKYDGKIILIGSTSGCRASPGWDTYAASKAALINFGLSLSEELKSENKQVYIVSPGRTASQLRQKLCPNENPKSIMQPEECAEAICKLLDDKGLVDGQNIIIRKVVK